MKHYETVKFLVLCRPLGLNYDLYLKKTHWFDPARQRIDGCFLHDWSRDMIKKHGANWTPQNSHGCWLNHFNSDDCYLNHHRLVGRIE